jgi:ribosomal protein S21
MVLVVKQKGESEDKLIARFKKKILDSGLLDELKDRQRFKSNAEKRKERKKRIKHAIELEKRRHY